MSRFTQISTELLRHDMLCLSDPDYIWFSAVNVISNHAGLVHSYPKNHGRNGHEIAPKVRHNRARGKNTSACEVCATVGYQCHTPSNPR